MMEQIKKNTTPINNQPISEMRNEIKKIELKIDLIHKNTTFLDFGYHFDKTKTIVHFKNPFI